MFEDADLIHRCSRADAIRRVLKHAVKIDRV